MRISALRPVLAAAAVAALLAPGLPAASANTASALESYATPADGVFRITGSGWGHGRGMSQWGAFQAASEGATFDQILAFYYPGTGLTPLTAGSVRVLLASDTGRDLIVRAVPGMTVQGAGAQPVALPEAPPGCSAAVTRWRARVSGSGLRLDAYCGRWVAVQPVGAPSVTFASPDGIIGTQNGLVRRGYRGVVSATRTGPRSVQVVNTVPMEEYLRAVVANEVSPSWPEESLKAQAVAARSYAAFEVAGRAGRPFDVYDTTRSQFYPGAVGYDSTWRVVRSREHLRTDQAIAATAGLHVVTSAGTPALTQFSSSNGGVTAASPLPYMTVQADGWDARAVRNPRLAWSRAVSAPALARSYRLGTVTAIEVLGREGAGPWGGRVTAVRIVGTGGTRVLTGDGAIRAGLGVNSSVLTFAPPAPPTA